MENGGKSSSKRVLRCAGEKPYEEYAHPTYRCTKSDDSMDALRCAESKDPVDVGSEDRN